MKSSSARWNSKQNCPPRVNWNADWTLGDFILNSIEIPNTEPDIGFRKGYLPENLGLTCSSLMRMYLYVPCKIKTEEEEEWKASAHKYVRRGVHLAWRSPAGGLPTLFAGAGNGGRQVEILSELAVQPASCRQWLQLVPRGYVFGIEKKGGGVTKRTSLPHLWFWIWHRHIQSSQHKGMLMLCGSRVYGSACVSTLPCRLKNDAIQSCPK